MKRLIIICTIFLVGCSSGKRTDCDSGGAKQNSYDHQQQQEQVESTREQFPAAGPSSEVVVP